MSQIAGFMCFGVLADGGNFFELIGPLLLFGVYIIVALAKKLGKDQQQESDGENQSELAKAVRKRYQQIHDRQVGNSPGRTQPQPPRRTEPVRTVQSARPVVESVPVRQVPRRTYPAHQVQAEKHRYPVQPNVQQKPVSVKTQAPKSAQRPKTVKKSYKAKSIKQRYTDYSLASMIRQSQNLRTAIILKEILDKPLALRD